jgi:putative hydrolase of the HAD superfamily
MKTRQVFFDLDRTLWDFETNSKFALQQLFDQHQLHNDIDHFIHFHKVYTRINAELWQLYGNGKLSKEELRTARFQKTLQHFNIHNAELVEALSEGYIQCSPFQTALFPGAIETLEALKNENYRLHIITNGFKEVQHIKLENSGLHAYFDAIICSEEVGVNKPNRKIFQHAQALTSCKSQHAIMVGDDMKTDVVGALNAGWSAIHFDPEHKIAKEHKVPRIRNLVEIPETVSMLPIWE